MATSLSRALRSFALALPLLAAAPASGEAQEPRAVYTFAVQAGDAPMVLMVREGEPMVLALPGVVEYRMVPVRGDDGEVVLTVSRLIEGEDVEFLEVERLPVRRGIPATLRSEAGITVVLGGVRVIADAS